MKIFTVLFIVFFASTAYAGTWCEWDGLIGENCQSDNRGYIMINNFPTKTPAIAHANGFYKLIITQPLLGENQVPDQVIWELVDSQITKTWTVRDMTTTEIDNILSDPMSVTDYYIWKTMLLTGVITEQQAINNLPTEMIDAYQARKRLLGD